MKILVTGGTGFIGSHTTVELLEEGFEVDVASAAHGEVSGKYHFKIAANLTFSEVEPEQYDGLLLPGGKAPEKYA